MKTLQGGGDPFDGGGGGVGPGTPVMHTVCAGYLLLSDAWAS